MAIYSGRQSILEAALGGFQYYGFRLAEPDDHFLELYFKDKKIATFYQGSVTIKIIREGCRNYLKSIARESGHSNIIGVIIGVFIGLAIFGILELLGVFPL